MKLGKFKLYIIIFVGLAFLFVVGAAIFLKLSSDSDSKISDSVKKEILKSVQNFQLPKLRLRSVKVQIQSEFHRRKNPPKIEMQFFKSVDDLYILKEVQDGEKELSLLGFFQLWQHLDLPNSGFNTRFLEEISFPNLDTLEKPNAMFSFREKLRNEISSINFYTEYVNTCRTGNIIQASGIHRTIPGNAILITCRTTTLEGVLGSKSRGYYFPSLGWYFTTDFENDFYKGHYKILSVKFSD